MLNPNSSAAAHCVISFFLAFFNATSRSLSAWVISSCPSCIPKAWGCQDDISTLLKDDILILLPQMHNPKDGAIKEWDTPVIFLVVFLHFVAYTSLAANEWLRIPPEKETPSTRLRQTGGTTSGASFHEDTQDGWSEKAAGQAAPHGLARRGSGFGERLPVLGKGC